ncbi:MAG: hypothetical protein VCA13_00835 [PS1 clade bacterium]|jgi:hypothetical protein
MIRWLIIAVLSWIVFVSLFSRISVLNKNLTRLQAYDLCQVKSDMLDSQDSECFKYWSPFHHWD